MTCTCIVDSHEKNIISILKTKGYLQNNDKTFEVARLDIADFRLEDSKDNNQKIILIERKTWSDLSSSLKDGRFREQRSRLLMSMKDNPNIKVCYLIEGPYQESFENEKHTLFRLSFSYQIPILYSVSIYNTIHILINNFLKKPNFNCFFEKRDEELDQVEARCKKQKKNFEDEAIFFQSCLCSIKGLSANMAKAIQNQFENLFIFNIEFFVDYEKAYKKLTTECLYKTAKQNEKTLPPKIIKSILDNFAFKNTIIENKNKDSVIKDSLQDSIQHSLKDSIQDL